MINKEIFKSLQFIITTFVIALVVGGAFLLIPFNDVIIEPNLTKPGVFPVVKQKITLTIVLVGENNPQFPISENLMTKEMERKTNIHIEWTVIPQGSFLEKINLMFASGGFPDIVASCGSVRDQINKPLESSLATQGLIIPLNSLVAEHSIWFKKVMKDLPELKKHITHPNGKYYSLPYINDASHFQYAQRYWINQSWLKKLGLSMPQTTDELYRVLKAFKTWDPNGNGIRDEIPLSTCQSGWETDLDGFLMAPFILTPAERKIWINKGKIVFGPIEPEYKDGLKYLHKLYAEGLIYPDSFIQDMKQQVNLNESGKNTVIGSSVAARPGYFCNLNGSNRWHEYWFVPPLKGPNGKRITPYYPYAKYCTGAFLITKHCQYPEAALRWIDWLYSEAGALRTYYGREGKEWVKADSNERGLDGRTAKYREIPTKPGDPLRENTINWGQKLPFYSSRDLQFSWAVPQDPYGPGVDPLVGRLRVFYLADLVMRKYAQPFDSCFPSLYYPLDQKDEMLRLKTNIYDYVNESVIRFITGNRSIENEWNQYLGELEQLGVKRYLRLIQEAYDRYNQN